MAETTAIEPWFTARGWQPFPFQRAVWAAYLAGASGLIHATTGTGKTYAALFGPLLEWQCAQTAKAASVPLRVLWVTPLRALATDTLSALAAPIAELAPQWTLETRTGDTSSATRARQRTRLPTVLITTPESLSLLLAREDSAALFAELRCVVVDEWHELMASKRGVQVELALARLRRLRPELRTWGLSATLGNLDVALAALIGVRRQESEGRSQSLRTDCQGTAGCTATNEMAATLLSSDSWLLASSARLIHGEITKDIQIDTIIPPIIERFPWAGHLGLRLLPQVIAAVEAVASCLIFTNTRAQTEIWYQAILEARPAWAGTIALHHGSLAREVRDWVEQGLRDGRLRCVVCTSSLDLGVDFSPVERVLQIGSPKGVARLLQRAGRSGHQPGASSRVTVVPTHALELLEVAAVRDAALAGQIEARPPIERPLDVLTQHLVTVALGGGFHADELYEEVRTSYAYRDLTPAEWQWALDFVVQGGPLAAYPEFRRVIVQDRLYRVADTQVARRHRMAIGTISADATITVQYLKGEKLGSVDESFIARLKAGDTFTFAGRTLEFVRLHDMIAWVRKASKISGSIPRWTGGRMPLSDELATAIRAKLAEVRAGIFDDPEIEALRPILALQNRWSRIPDVGELLVERVKTREGYHLFFFPFEGRSVHEGLAALVAHRLAQREPLSFTLAANDYGFELLAPTPPTLSADDVPALFSPVRLTDDIVAALNAAELARRQFREIARVAGLIVVGTPSERRSARQLQASSNLFYDVFEQYDPENLLLHQARREVLERQLEQSRLRNALERISAGRMMFVEVARPTPFAFPLLVDRLRESLSTEKVEDRVRRMQMQLEKAAG